MLSIPSGPAIVWPSATGPAVAPVSAATPVAPVQSTARDAQTGSGAFGRETPGTSRLADASRARADETDAPQAAPLLPRPQSEQGGGRESADARQAADKAEAEQELKAKEERAAQQRLQDVIANVWKASAAVVDMALGREAANASQLEAVAANAPVSAAPSIAAAPAAQPAAVATRQAAVDELEALKAQQDVLAYDAQGHSSLAPLEAGSLVSRRV